ncbi:MAG TPA: hypothetical protein VFD80_01015 [Flavobacteriaceae bacterium]|nr:hypothetical protein [Flavobacteriaceae bacterium]
MKNSILKMSAMLFIAALTLNSCSSDDDNTNDDDPTGFQFDSADFKGDMPVDVDVTLDPSKVYKLTGRVLVSNGSKLRIPAGTRIEGVGGTSAYIAVEQGGQIFINGTAADPVVMTSGLANPQPGDWGGLVICGKAPTNRGATAQAEVSDLTYGGTVTNDNSGEIKYLRIEYSGAAFNSEKEFNGLSLFGVGSGTTISHVQIHAGADDGIEFYGGTVSASNLVMTANEDDQFDWVEGWTGKNNSNWYGKLGLGRGNRGIEADNLNVDNMATPISDPKISNLTLIGLGDQGNEPQGILVRVGTRGKIDNIVIDNWAVGIEVRDDATLAGIPNDLQFTNVKFSNISDVHVKGRDNNEEPVDVSNVYTENENATGAGNGTAIPAWAQGWTVGL